MEEKKVCKTCVYLTPFHDHWSCDRNEFFYEIGNGDTDMQLCKGRWESKKEYEIANRSW